MERTKGKKKGGEGRWMGGEEIKINQMENSHFHRNTKVILLKTVQHSAPGKPHCLVRHVSIATFHFKQVATGLPLQRR